MGVPKTPKGSKRSPKGSKMEPKRIQKRPQKGTLGVTREGIFFEKIIFVILTTVPNGITTFETCLSMGTGSTFNFKESSRIYLKHQRDTRCFQTKHMYKIAEDLGVNVTLVQQNASTVHPNASSQPKATNLLSVRNFRKIGEEFPSDR